MGDVDTSTEAVLAWVNEPTTVRVVGDLADLLAALVAERDEARAENERLRKVLAANTAYEDTPCRFDHHGDCQEHLRGDIDGRCSVAVARELLAGVEAPAAGTDGGAP